MVAFDVFEVTEAASDEVLENVVGFSVANPIRSSSLDRSCTCIEGFRKSPFKDARAFSGLAEKVLLPDFMVGRIGTGLVGLGDLSGPGPGDGRFEDEASVGRILFLPVTGVLRDFAVLGRFIGVCGGSMVCGGRKVLVEALKSTGTELPEVLELELEVGLEIDRDGGLAGFSEL